jgi:hypothetical protein
MPKKYIVRLTDAERETLNKVIAKAERVASVQDGPSAGRPSTVKDITVRSCT